MEKQKERQADGPPKKKLVKQVLYINLRTSSGFMMKYRMSGQPDISRAAYACPKGRENVNQKGGTISGNVNLFSFNSRGATQRQG